MHARAALFVALVVIATSPFTSSVHAAPLGGVYARCATYTASPLEHFQANRAWRAGSGSSATYFARGSGTQLTSTTTLAETGRSYFEVRAACPLPPGCVRSTLQPPSGLGLHCRLSVPNQTTREYDVHVPSSHANLSEVPLVMEMHGGGGGALPPATEVTSGWREVSDTSLQPFVVVWPVGSNEAGGPYGAEWQTCNYDQSSAAQPCPAVGYPHDRNFLIEVLKKVVTDLKVDRRRVYATGLSSGAAMVHSLSCRYSEYLAAVAPMATGIHVQAQPRARDRFDLRAGCNPAREVPQFYVHSPHDDVSSFTEGAASVSYFRAKYGCTTAATQSHRSEIDLFDASDLAYPASWDVTTCQTTECGTSAAPSAVAFCSIDGSSDMLNERGHIVWFGDDFYFPVVQPFAPRLAQWAWDWMRRYALPSTPSWPPPLL